nr:Ig-like domain-containing protein [Mastigocoleus sp. MO_167.B18]
MSSTLSFDISSVQGNPANARITLTELGDGTIQVAVEVIDGTIADLRGLFFNISDESLVNGLSVAGDDVTGSRFRANRVNSLSLDVNMIGTDTEFDGGVKIGTSGIRRDDIQSTTFILSHDSVDLTLDLFENQDFGVRLTSVNNSIIPGSTSRRGSSKLVGTSDLAPDAVPDTVNTEEDTPVTIDVLGNDDQGDGPATVSVESGNGPANGTVSVNPDGTIDYTPDPDFFGEDTFTYTITDSDGDTSTAVVTVIVDPNPDAVNDSVTTDEDVPINIDVLANDDIAGEPNTTVTAVGNPSNGTVVINPDGTLTYTPDPNFNGTDNFEYTITDDDGDTSTATVTVTVDPVNDPPDAVNNNYTTNEDTPVSGNVITDDTGEGLDSDLDGDTLTVTGNSDPSNGSVTVNSDGSYTYTPDANFNGTDSFTYTISDGNGGTDTATVNITVDPVNDPPDAVNNNYTTNEDTPVSGNVITDDTGEGLDSDLDGDTLTVTGNSDPSNGSVTVNSDGSYTYTPDANFNGTDSFTYTISDGNGGTDTATVNITVDPVNDPPDAVNNNYTTNEDTPVSGNVITDDT